MNEDDFFKEFDCFCVEIFSNCDNIFNGTQVYIILSKENTMKNIYPIFLLIIFILGCDTFKKASDSKKHAPISNPEIKNNTNQQIPPGTCLLSIKDFEISSDKKTIKGKVSKIHGYGAGFTDSFHPNQEIEFKVDDENLLQIKNNSKISCVISQVSALNNKTYLKLIELK